MLLYYTLAADGQKMGTFPLLYVLKITFTKGCGWFKRAQTPLHNIKMVPKHNKPKYIEKYTVAATLVSTLAKVQ